MTPLLGLFEPGFPTAAWTAAGALAAAFALAAQKGRIARTTLAAPWWWTLLALLAVATTEVILGVSANGPSVGSSYFRYFAAAATFCPTMAVLGAKRPQDRGWQFIVAALWLVLTWPAWTGLILRPAGALSLPAEWQWFLLALWTMGLLNGLPTRHALAMALAGVGQMVLIAAWLPPFVAAWLPRLVPDGDLRALLGLLLCAGGAVVWGLRRPRPSAAGFDRVWLDFRDGYGAVWGLRTRERFNAAAALCGWDVRLRWSGLTAESGGKPDAEALGAARNTLAQLLRRFVSPAWLAERWGETEPALPAEAPPDAGHAAAAAGDYTEGH